MHRMMSESTGHKMAQSSESIPSPCKKLYKFLKEWDGDLDSAMQKFRIAGSNKQNGTKKSTTLRTLFQCVQLEELKPIMHLNDALNVVCIVDKLKRQEESRRG